MTEDFLCPRRAESFGAFPGRDTWEDRNGYQHCSYCGSLKPEALFQAIEVGAELGPTDKNYKVYVDLPDPRVGQPKIVGMRNSPPTESDTSWVKVTEENLPEVLADGWGAHNLGQWMLKTPRSATLQDKFYFQHLSPEEQSRFVDLLNAKKINIGSPGYFYSLPFFVVPAQESAAG